MMKLRGKVWLVVAFVALAALVFTGCPHNDILYNGGVSGDGARYEAGDNVKLIVTNFRTDGAGRSSARTIVPEHIDLSLQTEIEKYVFVASGTGDGIYEPEFIDITPVTGVATLKGIPGDGYWNITVEAYDVGKLRAANPALADRQTILGRDVADVTAQKTTALVLSGSASVQLGGSAKQVVLTLTNDNVGTTGDVDVAIYFSNDNEAQTIFDGTNKYKVSARLIDSVGTTVMGNAGGTSDVMLYDMDQRIDLDIPAVYEYRKYDSVLKTYEQVEVEDKTGDQKLLSYKPTNPPQGGASIQFNKGKYMLLVSVTDTTTGDVYYAADPDFVVEGNRTTKGVLEINGILGSKPAEPTGLEVYWKKPGVADILEGFDAIFKWGPSDMYAVGYEIEVADITSIYKNEPAGTNKIITLQGEQVFNNAQELWENNLDQTNRIADPSQYVTKLSWQVTPQNNVDIPRWLSGSLLAGNDNITVRLRTGAIYSVRVRAVNGTRRASDWVYFGIVNNGTDVTAGGTFTKFAQADANGIFDLVKVTYKLDNNDMYTLTGDRSADFKVTVDTAVTGENLVQVFDYDPNTAEQLSYAFTDATVTAQTVGDQVLVMKGDVDKNIVRSWIGWQDEKTHVLFGPANTQVTPAGGAGRWQKTDWKYDGFKDLVLVPVGAGGSGSVNVQSNTADTTNVLNLQTVGFGIQQPNTNTNNTVLGSLQVFATRNGEGVYKNTAGNKLVVVLGGTKTTSNTNLYVSIGDNNTDKVKDTLTDKNGNSIKVTDLKVELRRNGLQIIKQASGFTAANLGAAPTYAVFDNAAGGKSKLGGMMSGEYTLFVQMTTGEGRTQSTTIPVVVMYADQAQNQPAIP